MSLNNLFSFCQIMKSSLQSLALPCFSCQCLPEIPLQCGKAVCGFVSICLMSAGISQCLAYLHCCLPLFGSLFLLDELSGRNNLLGFCKVVLGLLYLSLQSLLTIQPCDALLKTICLGGKFR